MKNTNYRIKYLGLICGLAVVMVLSLLVGFRQVRPAQAESINLPEPPVIEDFPLGVFYVVTNTNGAGIGSLRRAIMDANSNSGADTIIFNIPNCSPTTPCVISPLNPLPLITDTLTISGTGTTSLVIDGNHANRGLRAGAVSVKIADLTVQNGATPGTGAGINSSGSLELVRVRLLGNTSGDNGGGVYAANGLWIIDSYLENNASSDSGGGAYSNTWFRLTNSQIISNTADYGGGVYASGPALIEQGWIEGNMSIGEGGGAFLAADMLLTDTTFVGNTAIGYGGGLYSYGNATISDGRFEQNHSNSDGGGLFVESSLDLVETTFIENTADGDGGGLNVNGGETWLERSWFENNHGESGGGLHTDYPLNLIDTNFMSNTANYDGGGVYASDTFSMTEGWFEGNQSGTNGGGLFLNGVLTMTQTTFKNNITTDRGGGAYISGPWIAASAYFLANQADSGGGVYHDAYYGIVINSLFSRNVANLGTALFLESPDIVAITNSTIVGQDAVAHSGIFLGNGSLGLSNTILTHHLIGIDNIGGTFIQDYNLFYGNGTDISGPSTGGTNSLTGDPHFLNPNGDDYHLTPGSAALDTGTTTGIQVDFEYDSRPQGLGYDIGFDEMSDITGQNQIFLPIVERS